MTTYNADLLDVYYGPPADILQAAYTLHGDATCTPDPHPILQFNMFYPKESIAGPMPASGWPVVMFGDFSGFRTTNKLTQITPLQAIQHPILENGLALAYMTFPASRGGAVGTNITEATTTLTADVSSSESYPLSIQVDDASNFDAGGGDIIINGEKMLFDSKTATTLVIDEVEARGIDGTTIASHVSSDTVVEGFNPSQEQYGKAYRGNGCQPISNGNVTAWPGPFPTDYEDAHPSRPHPMLDPLWLCPVKAAMWLVQFLKFNGIGGDGPAASAVQTSPARIGCYANSAGAIAFLWPAYQTNRAGLTGMGMAGMGAMNTRMTTGCFRNGTERWNVYNKTVLGPVGFAFAQRPAVSGNDDYDLPAANLEDVDTDFSTLGPASPDFYGTSEAETPGITALNNSTNFWWANNAIMELATINTPTRYIGNGANGLEVVGHTVYNVYRAKQVWPNIYGIIEDGAHVDPNIFVDGYLQLDEIITLTDPDLFQSAADFLQTNLELLIPVEEVVIRKVESTLAVITYDNGYQVDVRKVLRFEDMPDDVPLAPCIMIDAMDIGYDDGFTNTIMRKTLTLDLTLFLEGWHNQVIRLSTFMAEVEKVLYADETLGTLVENLHLRRGRRHLLNPDTHQYAVAEMSLDVIFRHTIGDPFTPFP